MAYQTGVLNTVSDIQLTIRNFLTSNGWTWDAASSTIYKDSIYIGFVAPASDKILFQAKSQLTGGLNAPKTAGVGRFINDMPSATSGVITYPCEYFAFLDNDEFYFIVNFNSSYYQYVMWGKSSIDVGSNGLGTYISGSVTTAGPYASVSTGSGIQITPAGSDGPWYGLRSAAPFWMTRVIIGNGFDLACDMIHTDLDGVTWDLSTGDTITRYYAGGSTVGAKMQVLPSAWSGESPLLPLRAYKMRSSNICSLVLDLKNARYCRIDNYNDKEELVIGSETWVVFPFFKRNVAQRNGGTLIDHTGTMGWAIRKVP